LPAPARTRLAPAEVEAARGRNVVARTAGRAEKETADADGGIAIVLLGRLLRLRESPVLLASGLVRRDTKLESW
jgi:hypothetical protein